MKIIVCKTFFALLSTILSFSCCKSTTKNYSKTDNSSIEINNEIIYIVADSCVLLVDNRQFDAVIKKENCVEIYERQKGIIFDKCFDDVMIIFDEENKNENLPLIFISGSHFIAAEFSIENNEWITDSLTYTNYFYGKETRKVYKGSLNLNSFDFEYIMSHSEDVSEKYD